MCIISVSIHLFYYLQYILSNFTQKDNFFYSESYDYIDHFEVSFFKKKF